MKTKPISTRNPSNAALAKGFNDFHDCLEDTRDQIAELRGAMDVLLRALNLPSVAQIAANGAPSQPTASMKSKVHFSPWQMLGVAGSAFGGVGGLLLALKVIAMTWPGFWHAIMTVG